MKHIALFALTSFALISTSTAAPVDFKAPKGWKKEKPANNMRKHQFRIPKSKGDVKDGELAVFHFSGGGSVEANIKRWKTQVRAGAKDPKAKQTTRTCGGLKVVIYDQTGTYQTPPRGPRAPGVKMAGARVINAIIETAEGNYYVKFVGPKKTIGDNMKQFHAFLDSLSATGKAKPKKPTSKPTSKPGN